jgi:hypothetical protein
MATFDGDALIITLPAGSPSVDVQEGLYSEWKEWVKLSDNAKYPLAFDTIGGDTISPTQEVAPYFFLRNDLGWRIKPAEENATVSLVGNLYGRNSTLPILVDTDGDYTVLVSIERSSSSIAVATGGGGGATAAEVWSYATRTLTSAGVTAIQDAILDDIAALQATVDIIKEIETGKWEMVSNQLIIYASDNTTEIARFNLFDLADDPTMTAVVKRVKV